MTIKLGVEIARQTVNDAFCRMIRDAVRDGMLSGDVPEFTKIVHELVDARAKVASAFDTTAAG